jgi:hypothetical protein
LSFGNRNNYSELCKLAYREKRNHGCGNQSGVSKDAFSARDSALPQPHQRPANRYAEKERLHQADHNRIRPSHRRAELENRNNPCVGVSEVSQDIDGTRASRKRRERLWTVISPSTVARLFRALYSMPQEYNTISNGKIREIQEAEFRSATEELTAATER